MTAVDKDKDQYGKIKYSIVTAQSTDERTNTPAQDIHQYFFINEETGDIRVQSGANLDREAGLKEIHFQVSAIDNPSNSNLMLPSEDLSAIHNRHVSRNQNQLNPFEDLYSEESSSSEIHQSSSFAFANVHVKVEDVNDNAPIFKSQNYTFKIYDYSDINREYNYYSTYFTNPRDELRNFVTQVIFSLI